MSVKEQDNKYAIDVAEVTKVYRLYEKPIDRLKESMSISHKNYHRDFYALNQLSFRVRKGETPEPNSFFQLYSPAVFSSMVFP